MPEIKFDVPSLNVRSHELFELSKVSLVVNAETQKDVEAQLEEITSLTEDANDAIKSGKLSPAEQKEVSRAIDKLSIARNFFQKTLGTFTAAVSDKKNAEESLAKERKKKEALIESRRKEKPKK